MSNDDLQQQNAENEGIEETIADSEKETPSRNTKHIVMTYAGMFYFTAALWGLILSSSYWIPKVMQSRVIEANETTTTKLIFAFSVSGFIFAPALILIRLYDSRQYLGSKIGLALMAVYYVTLLLVIFNVLTG